MISDTKPDKADPPDYDIEFWDTFGFYHDIFYVLDTWQHLRMYNLYPEAGGYNQQDERWLADIRTVQRLYSMIKDEISEGAQIDSMDALSMNKPEVNLFK